MDQTRKARPTLATLATLAERCRKISNLFIAYHNSGKSSDVFGREFFHAVGDVLNGTPLHHLEVFHIDPKNIPEVLLPMNLSGSPKKARRVKRAKRTRKTRRSKRTEEARRKRWLRKRLLRKKP